jgi:hypothetical protein
MTGPEPRRSFLLECYAPDISRTDVEAVGRRAASAAWQLRDEGHEIEYVHALLVPGDDAVFHVFVADAIDIVREAGERAGIAFERVVESVSVEAEPGPPQPGLVPPTPKEEFA